MKPSAIVLSVSADRLRPRGPACNRLQVAGEHRSPNADGEIVSHAARAAFTLDMAQANPGTNNPSFRGSRLPCRHTVAIQSWGRQVIDRRAAAAFEAMTYQRGDDVASLAAGLRRYASSLGLRTMAAGMMNVAAVAPERLTYFYESAAAGWLGRPPIAAPVRRRSPAPLQFAPDFWKIFWNLMEAPIDERRRQGFTAQLAYLAGKLPTGLNARVAAAALEFPGVAEAAAQGAPPHFDLGRLARCKPGSLGGEFFTQILSNRAELEILGRDDLGLDLLPPPLDYVNARILQCHGLWRIVAGYGVTTLDEIGLAAFQMGQFGHQYSAMFTAVVMATAAFHRETYVGFVLDTIFRGWDHGRQSPPLLAVDWEALLDLPVAEAQAQLGVPARSPDFDPLAQTVARPDAH
jgi:ubiquinone biosynthesis protein Coq4